MTNNWQYATLSAGERLSKIRNGEIDVYTQEISRTNEVIKNRTELGLDVSEQLAWVKKLDYVRTNNNGLGGELTPEEIDYKTKTGTQSNLQLPANFSGSDTTQVNRNTIGNIISNIKKASYAPVSSNNSYEQDMKLFVENQQKRKDELANTLNEKYTQLDAYYSQLNSSLKSETDSRKSDYYSNAVSRLPSMYEKFANSGISFDNSKTNSEQMSYNNALNKSLATIDAEATNAVNANNLSKASERINAYSEYTSRLAQENARLDNIKYRLMRDLQDNAFKQNQFEWEQYQYATQYGFEKYKLEQELRELAEKKTVEQLRWEKEFGLKLDAFEFDKMMKQNQLALDTGKFQFDKDKYVKEYALKLQEYDLRLKQYTDNLYFKQQDYKLKSQEFVLKYLDIEKHTNSVDNSDSNVVNYNSYDSKMMTLNSQLAFAAANVDVNENDALDYWNSRTVADDFRDFFDKAVLKGINTNVVFRRGIAGINLIRIPLVDSHYINLTWNEKTGEYDTYNAREKSFDSIDEHLKNNKFKLISLTIIN